jgi:DNA-binding MarR family transcriptional regulator
MKIPVRTTKDRFFRQILEILRSFPPINKLRPKELDLLAEFMKQNSDNASLPKNKRRIIIFSTENRKEIQDKLEMSQASFNNNLFVLRKHGLINKDNDLISLLDIEDIENYTIEIKLYVQDTK